MNFVEKLFLVNCVFAITASITANKLSVNFEEDARLRCSGLYYNPYHERVQWILNGRDLCTPKSTLCRQEEKYNNSQGMILQRVIRNGTYTCQIIYGNGRKVNVSETEVVVVPRKEEKYMAIGSNVTIYCLVKTPKLDLRLVRDGNESCNPEANWCSQRTGVAVGSFKYFDLFNLQATHTYTCEAYSENEKLATVEVHHIIVGSKPKIHKFTFSPPGLQLKGTEIFATASFYSPLSQTERRWDVYYGDHLKRNFKEELSVLSEDEYESKVSLGHVNDSIDVWLRVKNIYGYDLTYIKVRVGVKYGEWCDSKVVCETNNTYCDRETEKCLCRSEYVWNSTVCNKTNRKSETITPTTDLDEEYFFGNGISARLRIFDRKNKVMAMTKVQQILTKYEFDMGDKSD